MISIIICSIKPSLLNQLTKNIADTIGVEYEILAYDNRQTNWGITKVYNYCAEKAKYPYLVFCHEDILFHTKNWGIELINVLKKNEIGLVGICGATYKSPAPASWVSIPTSYYRSNLKNSKFKNNSKFSEVAVIDGLFISVKKLDWKNNKFNEQLIKGFHIYDIDYSLAFHNKKNVVLNTIEVEHFSEGNFNRQWFFDSLNYYKHKKKDFPIFTKKFSLYEKRQLDAYAWKSIFFRIKKLKLPKKYLILAMLKHFLLKPFSFDNLRLFKHFLYE